MTDEELIEQLAWVITESCHGDMYDRTGKFPSQSIITAKAILPFIHASRIEGARLMQEAAAVAADAVDTFDYDVKVAAAGAIAVITAQENIRALDPTKIIEEADNARNAR